MLDLLAFDLDGTLAETEGLKAQSYAYATRQLRPEADADAVVAAYTESCIGLSRREIATYLLHRFDLEDLARAHDASMEPWEAYVGIRLVRYRAMLADGGVVREHAREHAVALVRRAREHARRVAVVTTSGRRNAEAVLGALGLGGLFDALVTADDVARTKPDPEGYRLALSRLGAEAARSAAIEDSPAGIRGALAAGLTVFAVPTPLTEDDVAQMVETGEILAVTPPGDLAEAVQAASLSLAPAA
ncbi:MAG: HAD-IA family hydrolase [Bacteroidota bacterium]